MHELSLICDVVRMVAADATQKALARVTKVILEVGELSGALPHALKAAFPIASRGTIMEGAELVVDEAKAGMRCRRCRREFDPVLKGWACPGCGAREGELFRGTELRIVSYTGEEGE